MRGFLTDNDWNMDETGQFWKALPMKSLSVQSEQGKQCRGGKRAKQQCTWVFLLMPLAERGACYCRSQCHCPLFQAAERQNSTIQWPLLFNYKAWMKSVIMD